MTAIPEAVAPLPPAPQPSGSSDRPASAAAAWRAGLASAVTAALTNVAILLTASAGGGELVVRRSLDGPAMTIGVGSVLATTLVPILLGTLALLALRRRGPSGWRALSLLGLTIGLLTVPIPFTMLAETATKVGLGMMHAATGAIWFVLVRRAARRVI